MKKTLTTLLLSSIALSSYANEHASFYIGAKSGWASAHHGVTQFKQNATHTTASSVNRHAVAYGALMGYQFTSSIATELGYEYFGHLSVGGSEATFKDPSFKHSAQGTSLNLKYSYPITENLSTFAKIGGAYVYNNYKYFQTSSEKIKKFSKSTPSFIAGLGFDYNIAPELVFRTEYQYLNRVGKSVLKMNGEQVKYKPDFHSVTVGILYRFGMNKVTEEAPIQEVEKLFEFDTDVLFDFGKANLKASSTQALDKVYQDIANLELTHANINVNGYTDRLGSESFNLNLSQKRATNVANYIASKGINPEAINATGYGKQMPVTGNSCDNIKGRQALINCLAPDRRVSVQVKGTK